MLALREKGREERRLCMRALKTAVSVVLIEAQPDVGEGILGLGQAGDTSGGSGMDPVEELVSSTATLPHSAAYCDWTTKGPVGLPK